MTAEAAEVRRPAVMWWGADREGGLAAKAAERDGRRRRSCWRFGGVDRVA